MYCTPTYRADAGRRLIRHLDQTAEQVGLPRGGPGRRGQDLLDVAVAELANCTNLDIIDFYLTFKSL